MNLVVVILVLLPKDVIAVSDLCMSSLLTMIQVLCSICCGCCVSAKMLAYSLDQPCACVNHCGPFCALLCIVAMIASGLGVLASYYPSLQVTVNLVNACGLIPLYALIRYNLRMKFKIGSPDSWLGDCFIMCCICTEPCAACQDMRSMPVSEIDLFSIILTKHRFPVGTGWASANKLVFNATTRQRVESCGLNTK